jgi:hypothetical protein
MLCAVQIRRGPYARRGHEAGCATYDPGQRDQYQAVTGGQRGERCRCRRQYNRNPLLIDILECGQSGPQYRDQISLTFTDDISVQIVQRGELTQRVCATR